MISQEVGCCGARSWALVIGWLQAISNAIVSFILICATIWFAYAVNHQEDFPEVFQNTTQFPPNETNPFDLFGDELITSAEIPYIFVFLAFLMLVCFAFTFLGSFLICSVKQRNAGKVKAWLIVNLVILIFSVFSQLIYAFEIDGMMWIKCIIGLIINLFFLWVVNVHRQELLGLSAGEMIHSYEYNGRKI